MNADAGRRRRILALALAVGVLSLTVVAVSAYLRLDAAGLGCADWPACYGGLLAGAPAPQHYGFARLLHRIAASAALVLACVLVWQCLRPQPLPAARPAALLLLLMLGLSALGFLSADPRRALVGFLNIVGGLGLVSFSWRVALAAGDGRQGWPRPAPGGALFRLGVAALTLTVLVGAWIGATYSALACPSLPFCAGGLRALAEGWPALDPLRSLAAVALPGDAGGTLLHLLHRGLALASVFALGGALLVAARRGVRRGGALAALVLLLLVAGLGMAAVAGGLGLWMVIAHGTAAALLLAAVAALLRR
ncbi:MAG: COX15/CtaA family protein [Rhodocyclaceae bacterium]|nr:COX15/CtaA family protein [Rhodocyclaceae bacterium]